jgi:hypothetical protein
MTQTEPLSGGRLLPASKSANVPGGVVCPGARPEAEPPAAAVGVGRDEAAFD